VGQVIVRNLDDRVIAILKRRAELRGCSLEQELRDTLTEAAAPMREDQLAEIDRIRAMTPPGSWPLSEDIVRQDRDSR
jgi:plasmid stability protein